MLPPSALTFGRPKLKPNAAITGSPFSVISNWSPAMSTSVARVKMMSVPGPFLIPRKTPTGGGGGEGQIWIEGTGYSARNRFQFQSSLISRLFSPNARISLDYLYSAGVDGAPVAVHQVVEDDRAARLWPSAEHNGAGKWEWKRLDINFIIFDEGRAALNQGFARCWKRRATELGGRAVKVCGKAFKLGESAQGERGQGKSSKSRRRKRGRHRDRNGARSGGNSCTGTYTTEESGYKPFG